MIRAKGKLFKVAGRTLTDELDNACDRMPDGKFRFLVVDDRRNKTLPYLSYLFSVALKYISDALPDHPGTTALYRYFEDMFAPIHTVEINGSKFEYCDLKSEKAVDVNNVVERIVDYAREKWGIEVPTKEELRDPSMVEFYSQAYLNQEVEWSNFISSRKKLSKDERRNKNERI